MRLTLKKKIAAAGLAAATIVGGATAYAYWSTSGSGTGSATAADNNGATDLLVEQVNSQNTGTLVPAGPAGTFDVKVTNHAAGSISAGAITPSVHAFSVQTNAGLPACTEADFTVTAPSTGNSVGVLAHDASTTITGFSVSMNNNPTSSQDNCKGVAPVLDFSVAAS